MPEVSVIIPTYNRAHLVGRAIKSVLNQTYEDFELIVVDDGSEDETEKIVRGFYDRRIRYIKHEMNRGGNAARNTGIKESCGRYISFLDSDDSYLPTRLEKTVNIIRSLYNNKCILYTNQKAIINGKEILYLKNAKSGWINKEIINKEVAGGPTIQTNTVLIPKEFLRDELFDERLTSHQDWDLFIRLSKKYVFKYIDEVLSIYYPYNKDAIWSGVTKEENIQSAVILLNKYRADFKSFPKAFAALNYFIGHNYCLLSKMKLGRRYLRYSIKADPSCAKYKLAYFLSFLGWRSYKKVLFCFNLLKGVKM